MELHPNVTIIPAKPKLRDKNVAIYARVSSNSKEQLKSLQTQISSLTRLTAANPTWLLRDVYMDIASSKTGSNRKEFNRMVADCVKDNIDIVITKSISRFGRDTVTILSALEEIAVSHTRVIFVAEGIDTDCDDARLYISIHGAYAQAENESRSENIRWGILQHVEDGASKLLNRKCYGYVNVNDGSLVVDEEQALVVRLIYNMYLDGASVLGIIRNLEELEIKSPTGKDKWTKGTIEKMLVNEKYIGNVILLDNGNYKNAYKFTENNPMIVTPEVFDAVQIMRGSRSNILRTDDGQVKRKSSKYSSKEKKTEK